MEKKIRILGCRDANCKLSGKLKEDVKIKFKWQTTQKCEKYFSATMTAHG